MELEFLEELYEARMTRNSGDTAKLTFNDCCERLYLSLLVLELLRQYPKYTSASRAYAKATKAVNYNRFQMQGTDLHNFIYFVNGDDEALSKLKDPPLPSVNVSLIVMLLRVIFPVLRTVML